MAQGKPRSGGPSARCLWGGAAKPNEASVSVEPKRPRRRATGPARELASQRADRYAIDCFAQRAGALARREREPE